MGGVGFKLRRGCKSRHVSKFLFQLMKRKGYVYSGVPSTFRILLQLMSLISLKYFYLIPFIFVF